MDESLLQLLLALVALVGSLIAIALWRRRDPVRNILRELGIRDPYELNAVQFAVRFPSSFDRATEIYLQSCVDVERDVSIQVTAFTPKNERFDWLSPAIELGPGDVAVLHVRPPVPATPYPALTVSITPRITGPRGNRYRRSVGHPYTPPPSDVRLGVELFVEQALPFYSANTGSWITRTVPVVPGTERQEGTIESRLLWPPPSPVQRAPRAPRRRRGRPAKAADNLEP